MAIFKCPECGHMVSDKAPRCPGCGIEITPELLAGKKDNTSQTIDEDTQPVVEEPQVIVKQPIVEEPNDEDPVSAIPVVNSYPIEEPVKTNVPYQKTEKMSDILLNFKIIS